MPNRHGLRYPRLLQGLWADRVSVVCTGLARVVIFFFPYNPTPPPYPDKPPARPTPKSLISVHFGSVWLRFGSVWLRLAPFRVCFGSVSGPFRGVGWGRGGVGERGFCKGKEYH